MSYFCHISKHLCLYLQVSILKQPEKEVWCPEQTASGQQVPLQYQILVALESFKSTSSLF